MTDMGDGGAGGPEGELIPDNDNKWQGYADYQNVAVDLRKATNRAIEAYSHIQSRHSSGVGVTPQTAVNTKSALLNITKRIRYEVKKNAHEEPFGAIYERWAGVKLVVDDDSDGMRVEDSDEEGYVDMLESVDFRTDYPRWLDQLVDDLIAAGWELGYIRAGVEKPTDPEQDEEQVEEMFE